MKKLFIALSMALVSYVFAGEHPVKYSETDFINNNGKIATVKISNANLIADCTAEAGASLQYLAEPGATDDFLVVVDPCGAVLCTNSVIHLSSTDWVSVTNKSLVSEVGTVKIDFLNGQGGGFLLFEVAKTATSTGTNLTIKGAGALETSAAVPATLQITVSGDFKPAKTCPQ